MVAVKLFYLLRNYFNKLEKLFELDDINHMEYVYSLKSMRVFINGIVKFKGKETSILEIECDYDTYCRKYLEFIKLKR